MKPRVIVTRTAGTNCDYETKHAFELAGAQVELVHINRLIDRSKSLDGYDILAIPGGFSYGDDISAGVLQANELRYKIKEQIDRFVQDGKLIIGICNGFQVLVKSGLLPGFPEDGGRQVTTLHLNDSAKFECRWVYLKKGSDKCVFTKGLKKIIYLPVAHAEGKFMASDEVLDKIEQGDQVVFRYVDKNGNPSGYPSNPNGSMRDIAGICDPTGRIFGLMPHPERYLRRLNHPRWTRETLPDEGDGLAIFRNAVDYCR